ncbi:MAG: ATP-binding protein [Clostridia bacterium]|nr:ATP-binding protein [Clostridia bacterium]
MGAFDAVFLGAVAAAEGRIQQRQEDDYIGEDGILMCGACHEALYLDIEVPLIGPRRVPRMCACDRKREEERAAREFAQAMQMRILELRKAGITNDKYNYMTLANDDGKMPDIRQAMEKYIDKREAMKQENIGILFHGGLGGGKTFWAAALANAMIDLGESAIITTLEQLLTAIRANFEADKSTILGRLDKVEWLVLDELKFDGMSEREERKILEIIESRYLARRPLIVTTNMTLDEIAHPTGSEDRKRICNKILEMCGWPVYVKADGRRMAIAKEKSEKAREILGI